MADDAKRDLRLLETRWCPQYESNVRLYIEQQPTGRALVAQYETGGYEGIKEFAAAIPADWKDLDVKRYLAMPGTPKHPIWELSTRLPGSPVLKWPLG
jgi:hypothetical protein